MTVFQLVVFRLLTSRWLMNGAEDVISFRRANDLWIDAGEVRALCIDIKNEVTIARRYIFSS